MERRLQIDEAEPSSRAVHSSIYWSNNDVVFLCCIRRRSGVFLLPGASGFDDCYGTFEPVHMFKHLPEMSACPVLQSSDSTSERNSKKSHEANVVFLIVYLADHVFCFNSVSSLAKSTCKSGANRFLPCRQWEAKSSRPLPATRSRSDLEQPVSRRQHVDAPFRAPPAARKSPVLMTSEASSAIFRYAALFARISTSVEAMSSRVGIRPFDQPCGFPSAPMGIPLCPRWAIDPTLSLTGVRNSLCPL